METRAGQWRREEETALLQRRAIRAAITQSGELAMFHVCAWVKSSGRVAQDEIVKTNNRISKSRKHTHMHTLGRSPRRSGYKRRRTGRSAHSAVRKIGGASSSWPASRMSLISFVGSRTSWSVSSASSPGTMLPACTSRPWMSYMLFAGLRGGSGTTPAVSNTPCAGVDGAARRFGSECTEA